MQALLILFFISNRGIFDAGAGDGQSFNGQNSEVNVIGVGHLVANLGQAAKFSHNQAANRINIRQVFFTAEVYVFFQILNQIISRHFNHPGGELDDRLAFQIELISYFPNHFFHQVFQGDDSGGAAKLIQNNGQVNPLAFESGQ